MKLRITKLKLLLLMIMSAVGVIASTTVLVVFYTLNESLPICPTGTISIFGYGIHLDCGAVLTSRYSVFFGVPLEILALGYFIVNLALVYMIAFGSDRLSRTSLRVLFGWRFIGIVIVPYLVFIEVIVIKAICVYCTIMHVAIIADFIIISYLLFLRHSDSADLGPEPPMLGKDMPSLHQYAPISSLSEVLCKAACEKSVCPSLVVAQEHVRLSSIACNLADLLCPGIHGD